MLYSPSSFVFSFSLTFLYSPFLSTLQQLDIKSWWCRCIHFLYIINQLLEPPDQALIINNMIMSYRAVNSASVTTADCQKQVRSWRLLRSFMELLIPTCNCFIEENREVKEPKYITNKFFYEKPCFISSAILTGTIYGNRRGKVSLCIQTNPKSMNPILLLEMAVPTSFLAREMKEGFLRIALACNTSGKDSLLSMPLWTMYCNGRKVGFAVKRKPSTADIQVLRQMESVVVGAGIINGKEITRDDDVMYLRGNFERVHGSYDSESFHLIDPDGNIGQELGHPFFLSRADAWLSISCTSCACSGALANQNSGNYNLEELM